MHGSVTRTGSLNLASLQSFDVGSQPTDLQRYILALALVSFSASENSAFTLRQGCQLVADLRSPRTIKKVFASGKDTEFEITSEDALAFATKAAETFGVAPPRKVAFDSDLANRIRRLWTVEKTRERLKELAKTRPLTMAELDVFEGKAADSKSTEPRKTEEKGPRERRGNRK